LRRVAFVVSSALDGLYSSNETTATETLQWRRGVVAAQLEAVLAARPAPQLVILSMCSYPCGQARLPGFNPDLQMVASTVDDLRVPVRLRVLVMHREFAAAVASTTKERDFAPLPLQLHAMRDSLVMLNAQLASLPAALYRVLRFETLVSCPVKALRAVCEWLGLPTMCQALTAAATSSVRRVDSKEFKFLPIERFLIEQLFEQPRSRILWPLYDRILDTHNLLPCSCSLPCNHPSAAPDSA